MEKTTYTCGECGAAVEVIQCGEATQVQRSCEHADAKIIANLHAVATGESKVAS